MCAFYFQLRRFVHVNCCLIQRSDRAWQAALTESLVFRFDTDLSKVQVSHSLSVSLIYYFICIQF